MREGARRHGVSPHTLVATYDRLLAAGSGRAQRQRGFFVRERTAYAARSEAPAASPPDSPRVPVDASTLIRGMLGSGGRPGPAWALPPAWLDRRCAAALRRVLASGREGRAGRRRAALRRAGGRPRLRGTLAHDADVGVRAAAPIMTTLEPQASIWSRALSLAYDAVLIDEPSWSVEYARPTLLGNAAAAGAARARRAPTRR